MNHSKVDNWRQSHVVLFIVKTLYIYMHNEETKYDQMWYIFVAYTNLNTLTWLPSLEEYA